MMGVVPGVVGGEQDRRADGRALRVDEPDHHLRDQHRGAVVFALVLAGLVKPIKRMPAMRAK